MGHATHYAVVRIPLFVSEYLIFSVRSNVCSCKQWIIGHFKHSTSPNAEIWEYIIAYVNAFWYIMFKFQTLKAQGWLYEIINTGKLSVLPPD